MKRLLYFFLNGFILGLIFEKFNFCKNRQYELFKKIVFIIILIDIDLDQYIRIGSRI